MYVYFKTEIVRHNVVIWRQLLVLIKYDKIEASVLVHVLILSQLLQIDA